MIEVWIEEYTIGQHTYYRIIHKDRDTIIRALILSYDDALQVARINGWVVVERP